MDGHRNFDLASSNDLIAFLPNFFYTACMLLINSQYFVIVIRWNVGCKQLAKGRKFISFHCLKKNLIKDVY